MGARRLARPGMGTTTEKSALFQCCFLLNFLIISHVYMATHVDYWAHFQFQSNSN